jgi:hypothetical protein
MPHPSVYANDYWQLQWSRHMHVSSEHLSTCRPPRSNCLARYAVASAVCRAPVSVRSERTSFLHMHIPVGCTCTHTSHSIPTRGPEPSPTVWPVRMYRSTASSAENLQASGFRSGDAPSAAGRNPKWCRMPVENVVMSRQHHLRWSTSASGCSAAQTAMERWLHCCRCMRNTFWTGVTYRTALPLRVASYVVKFCAASRIWKPVRLWRRAVRKMIPVVTPCRWSAAQRIYCEVPALGCL